GLDRQQIGVAPEAQRSCGDLLARDRRSDRVVVVRDLERAETPLAGEYRCGVVLTTALSAAQALHMNHRSVSLFSRRAPSASSDCHTSGGRSLAAHRSGIGTWLGPGGSSWLPRRQRACPSAALDERVDRDNIRRDMALSRAPAKAPFAR